VTRATASLPYGTCGGRHVAAVTSFSIQTPLGESELSVGPLGTAALRPQAARIHADPGALMAAASADAPAPAIARTSLFAPLSRPLRPLGGFYAMTIETFRAIPQTIGRRSFPFGEFLDQTAFITSVSLFPAVMLMIPFLAVVIFEINQLLIQIGALDFAGAGVGLAVLLEVAPLASVLVVAGAGATAITADLGARTIREEIDAMEVLGINPIHRLVMPRVLASMLVAVCLNALLTTIGVATGYFVAVVIQGASAGQFVANLTLLTGLQDFVIGEIKALTFGLAAGLVACYRGLTVSGGPKGVGDAVNQTVILSFVVLFLINNLITGITLQGGLG
jgi:phospholipid/cholesterol/gamma-HCH transport system permease protein